MVAMVVDDGNGSHASPQPKDNGAFQKLREAGQDLP